MTIIINKMGTLYLRVLMISDDSVDLCPDIPTGKLIEADLLFLLSTRLPI